MLFEQIFFLMMPLINVLSRLYFLQHYPYNETVPLNMLYSLIHLYFSSKTIPLNLCWQHSGLIEHRHLKTNKYAMTRNWGNQNPNLTFKTNTGNNLNYKQSKYKENSLMANRASTSFPKGGYTATQTQLK